MGLLDTPDGTTPAPALTVDQQIALQHAKAAENIARHLDDLNNYLVNTQAVQLQTIVNTLAEDFRKRHGHYPGSER
ncbi:hypothetical protein KIH27_21380 [Mycobacterium sp. M1]|uniref:Uncharacterized protein n=1 Tax=Mycolicibacter acidiphilus TaxID=2835306 RepID=A0ABS5RPC3_9MYCO|nr:hypothetical protein [Mycolicibacter acidiphilus]MBS9536140.1 hypothetical protein [Mycolicibacter acidiphilus]